MFENCKEWVKRGIAGAVTIGTVAIASAQSEAATDYDSFLTELQSGVTEKMNAIWPVLAAVLLIVVGFFLAQWAWRKIRGAAGR